MTEEEVDAGAWFTFSFSLQSLAPSSLKACPEGCFLDDSRAGHAGS